MPPPAILPSNVPAELWPDTFGAEALDIHPFDPTTAARAFEAVALTVELRPTKPFSVAGIVPPLELIVAAPSGVHERRELLELPIALMVIPNEGGTHRVTLREQAHNRWWGSTEIDVIGEPVS